MDPEIRRTGLDEEEHVGEEAEVVVWQVVGDYFHGVGAEREEPDPGEHALEQRRQPVCPRQHALEAMTFLHGALQRRQEYLARVAEHYDAQCHRHLQTGHCIALQSFDITNFSKYFCDSSNNIKISTIHFFCSSIFVVISSTLPKNLDNFFGSEW